MKNKTAALAPAPASRDDRGMGVGSNIKDMEDGSESGGSGDDGDAG